MLLIRFVDRLDRQCRIEIQDGSSTVTEAMPTEDCFAWHDDNNTALTFLRGQNATIRFYMNEQTSLTYLRKVINQSIVCKCGDTTIFSGAIKPDAPHCDLTGGLESFELVAESWITHNADKPFLPQLEPGTSGNFQPLCLGEILLAATEGKFSRIYFEQSLSPIPNTAEQRRDALMWLRYRMPIHACCDIDSSRSIEVSQDEVIDYYEWRKRGDMMKELAVYLHCTFREHGDTLIVQGGWTKNSRVRFYITIDDLRSYVRTRPSDIMHLDHTQVGIDNVSLATNAYYGNRHSVEYTEEEAPRFTWQYADEENSFRNQSGNGETQRIFYNPVVADSANLLPSQGEIVRTPDRDPNVCDLSNSLVRGWHYTYDATRLLSRTYYPQDDIWQYFYFLHGLDGGLYHLLAMSYDAVQATYTCHLISNTDITE